MTSADRRRLQVLALIAETMGRDPDDLATCDCNLCHDARMRYGRLADRIEAVYAETEGATP